MKVRVPGKLVISGAYSVLFGAPALATAVSRGVVADTERSAEFVGDEVRELIARRLISKPAYLDVSELRTPDFGRKLGLGSSAAVTVATLLAGNPALLTCPGGLDVAFREALAVHRAAQGGGSGIDVACSAFGGTVAFSLPVEADPETSEGLPQVRSTSLPEGLRIEVFRSGSATLTSGMVKAVLSACRASKETGARAVIEELKGFAAAASQVTSCDAMIAALGGQVALFQKLGPMAGVEIVSSEVTELLALASKRRAIFMPSGAGGGDVAMFIGDEPSDARFREAAAERGYLPIECGVAAPGPSFA